jgi:hypothetical protein
MNSRGVPEAASTGDLLVRSRSAMLDALDALAGHRDAIIVIGAQAVYLRTGSAAVALAEATKDSDLAIDPRSLREDPRVEAAMRAAGFVPNPIHGNPGAWVNAMGIPVDLMVPEALAGPGGPTARAARLPPHDRQAMRRARGLEAAIVDNSVERVRALDPADSRVYETRVAGPAALLVAKTHKIIERVGRPHRLNDKDAHDMYRILVAVETEPLVAGFRRLLANPVSSYTTGEALAQLNELAAAGPEALIPMMAGRAEEGLGDPPTVALSTSLLAKDLITALEG